ncbi:type II toxin-antitoxin system Y4mF family antitoxin [Xylophilus rhododendri]|uniref:Type II toxin-antitoxin system Y4mF family antitoxin n=1 Tax=Xylophilus rhododendri TaxID=2697032 RepID=A0A857J4H0_9BURK|nr:type II toxin-antitoxin system Y4mF family antitoxin [Xylophilus rhododendri]QHI98860.1 type II toxin-antitoxin system Y4mF family antitoxin [Xylophilus rhododendri]
MIIASEKLPDGNFFKTPVATPVRTSAELGALLRERRKLLQLKQTDLAGIGNTGNRFIVDLENGKPTVQLQKVLDVLDLLGLEVLVRPRKGSL